MEQLPIALLPFHHRLTSSDRRLLGEAADILWSDLLECVSDDLCEECTILDSLPPSWRARAYKDKSRWLATLATILWKLAQPRLLLPANMAEQLLIGILVDEAESIEQIEEREERDLFSPLQEWLEEYLEDRDHEMLVRPDLDGIDNVSTNYAYGFGRMDYEGAFAIFNPRNDSRHGQPNPLADVRDDTEDQEAKRLARRLAAEIASAALAGKSQFSVKTPAQVDLEVVRHYTFNSDLDVEFHIYLTPTGLLVRILSADVEILRLRAGQEE